MNNINNSKIRFLKAAAVSFSLVLLSVFSASVSAADNSSFKSMNYGTDDNMIFGEKGIAFFSIKDEEGNLIDAGDYQLSDSKGKIIADWSGNNPSTFKLRSNESGANLLDSRSNVCVYGAQFPDFAGEGYIRSISVKDGDKSVTVIKPDGLGVFRYGNTYETNLRYVLYEDTDLIIAPHSFGIYADAGWADRKVDWFFSIGQYSDPNDSYSDFIPLNKFVFNTFAGNLNLAVMDDGKYPYRFGYTFKGRGGGGGNINQRITFDETEHEYVKKTINLYETFPDYFNADGTKEKEFFGTNYHFNFYEDSLEPFQTAGMYFLSGNMVSAPIPDKDGNVTIYVDKENYYFLMCTDFAAENASGGGSTGMSGYADNKAVISFSTVTVPETGIALKQLPEGEYTISSGSLPKKYEKGSEKIIITNESGNGVPECSLVLGTKRRAVNILESEYGQVSAEVEDTGAVPVESTVKINTVPEKDVRIKGLSFYDDMGFPVDDIAVVNNNTFIMPYTDISVKPEFGKVVTGDIDGNDTIDALDAVYMKKMLFNTDLLKNEDYVKAADTNGDGNLNVFDFIRFLKIFRESNMDFF